MAEYVHPEALVSADWVQEHRNDPKVRIVESDEDVLLYDMGHIPGAVKIDWQGDLQDQLIRDYIDAEKFAAICSRSGIAHDTTVVFYGDKSNWWACYAFWAVKLAPDQEVVAYCRIGERSSLTWFVLTYLLGYPRVRNYDGSWCEWGNLVRAPIAKGA